MTRKFKSTITDWVAVQNNSTGKFKLYNAKNEYEGFISFPMVVDSNDWQEITEKPILVTEDGYEIYSYHTTLKEVAEDFGISYIDPDDTSKNPVFYEEKNAKAYIERHKPRYSNEDLDSLMERIEVIKGAASDKIEMKAKTKVLIRELKSSKND